MKVAVVINQSGGSATDERTDEDGLKDSFERAGIAASIEVVAPEQLTAALAAALEQEIDALVVGGGDGTISAAAGIVANTGIPLGILPLGTANHFAQDLQIPLDIEEAVRTIAAGEVRSLSAAEVNGKVFINNSMLGFYPHVVKARSAIRRRFPLNKILSRWIAAAQVFPGFPLISVEMEAEGRTTTCTTPFLFIGAHEYVMDVFSFGAPSRTDRDQLFVYMVRAAHRTALLKLFLMGFLKDIRQDKYFEAWSASQVTIRMEESDVTVFADGELTQMKSPLVYRSLPGALHVFAPSETET